MARPRTSARNYDDFRGDTAPPPLPIGIAAHDMHVSIVINNYNYGRFIGAAIKSALAQSHANTEVIVVDDGSSDESREVISTFANITPVLKKNGGQASAFTAGVRASQGDVVLFLDADDTLLPHACEKAVEALRHPGAIKTHWPLLEMSSQGTRTGRVLPRHELAHGDLLAEVIRHGVPPNWGHGLGHAYRRSFLDRVLPIRDCGDHHGADSYLCVLAPIFGRIERVDEPLGCYRKHGTNFAGGCKVRYRLQRDARRYPFFFKWLEHYLNETGIEVDTAQWYRDGSAYAWTQNALALQDDLDALQLGGDAFVLIEDGLLGADFYPGAVQMVEKGGQYWGPPKDDDEAIGELERHREAGASHVAFAAASFWWLSHYGRFNDYLVGRYRCVCRNDRLVAFDLRRRVGAAAI